MSEIKRIGVLTSGGDCAGLNAVISAVVAAAEKKGWEVYGIHDGTEGITDEERIACLRPVEELFSDLEPLRLPDFYRTLCRNGCEIYLKKLGVTYPIGTRLRLGDAEGGFFALGEVMEFEDGPAVKAIKIFVL